MLTYCNSPECPLRRIASSYSEIALAYSYGVCMRAEKGDQRALMKVFFYDGQVVGLLVDVEWLVIRFAVGPVFTRHQVGGNIEEIGLDEVGLGCDL